jgi:hypothetical protein
VAHTSVKLWTSICRYYHGAPYTYALFSPAQARPWVCGFRSKFQRFQRKPAADERDYNRFVDHIAIKNTKASPSISTSESVPCATWRARLPAMRRLLDAEDRNKRLRALLALMRRPCAAGEDPPQTRWDGANA